MADDPAYVVPGLPMTDDEYLAQLAAIDAQLGGLGGPAPLPLDTVLAPPPGSNDRHAPPPPPPPPEPQQVGVVPVPAAAATVGADVVEPSAGHGTAAWTPIAGPGAGILGAAGAPPPPATGFDPRAAQARVDALILVSRVL